MKSILFVAGAAIVGNMIAEKFILKSTAEDPTGFVVVSEGLGMDDAWRAGVIAAVYLLGKKLLPSLGA